MDTSVKLFNYNIKNPVIPASGTFGFGAEFADIYDLNILGSIALKGTTLEARYGNPLPRIAECPSGMINSIGLQNPGVHEVLKEINKLEKHYAGKVIANVGGHSVDDYIKTCEAFNECDKVFAIELNISCPNVKSGGMSFGTNAKIAENLVYEVKKHTLKPVIVKLSPNVTDIAEIAKAVCGGGADGVSLINTLVGMRLNLKTAKPIISVGAGGYSGKGVFPIAVNMVYKVYRAVSVPIIGMGGVSSGEDVVEMMYAGASAVMVGSQNLIEPSSCKRIIEELPRVMKENGIENLKDIIGKAHK